MLQSGKCPMCGGTMTEDSAHMFLVCDFCGNKEPINNPVSNQTSNQVQNSNNYTQTTQHSYGNYSRQNRNVNNSNSTQKVPKINLIFLIILAVAFWPAAVAYLVLIVLKAFKINKK